jgi:hypothetical protein
VQQTNLVVALDVRSELARNNILAVLGSCAVTLRVIGADSSWEDVSSLASLRNHHAVYFTDVIDKAFLDSLASVGFRKLDKVLLVREDTKDAVQDNPLLVEFNHVLSSTPECISHQLILSTIHKIREKDYFGVDKCLAFGAHVHAFTLSNSEERKWFREKLFAFVSSLEAIIERPTDTFAQFALEVQDELLMNAIWDANPARRDFDRGGPVVLAPHEHVRVEWSFDGTLLAIGVRDPFGSFETAVVLKYLKYLFSKDRKARIQMQQDGPGAGLGLYMVLERLSSLIITVEPGQCTEVIATLNLGQNPRMMAKMQRSFQYFSV